MDTEYEEDIQPREHRAGAWIILIVGVLAIGLGFFQFRESITAPFAVDSKFQTDDQIEQDRLDTLKTKDTDQDGITDFDETYVFNTSPYLEDSDSDGFTDKEELESGNDPNCPEGKECGALKGDISETNSFFEEEVVNTEDIDLEIVEAMLNPSPSQIRQLLLDSGVSKAELDSLDDETLTLLYQESLREVQSQNIGTP